MQHTIYPNGSVVVNVPASSKITIFSRGTGKIQQQSTFTNQPPAVSDVASVNNGSYTSSAFSAAATLIVSAGASPVYYAVGTAPVIRDLYSQETQGTPVALDATGSITAAAMLGGIVTSATTAAVAGTVPTGTTLDAASEFAVGDSFDWSVIVTGGTNDFTVTAATDHTLVGDAVVVHSTSGLFRTRKTAANTFVTYRIA